MPNVQSADSLKGFCLLAMPSMEEKGFARSVILICSHDKQGALGFILNQRVSKPSLREIYQELNLKDEFRKVRESGYDVGIYRGGPVEKGRGFVLHSKEFSTEGTVSVSNHLSFTSTLGALKSLAGDEPPGQAMIMLGYSGWSGGQLEKEIGGNSWLIAPASQKLIFKTAPERKYETALAGLGIDEAALSSAVGRA